MRQNAVRTALALYLPPDPQERLEHRFCFARAPETHAAAVKTRASSGASSPCSIVSAGARNTSASTFLMASASVLPKAFAPVGAETSASSGDAPATARKWDIAGDEKIPESAIKDASINGISSAGFDPTP